MQKARSSIQSTKTYTAFQAFQLQDLPQALQFFKDIPVIHDIPDIPVIHDIPAIQASLHVPAPSSTNQYLPVLSSAIQCIQGFHPFQHFFNYNANSTHRLVSTRNSIEYQSKTIQTLHSSKKGRCCDIGQMLTYSPEWNLVLQTSCLQELLITRMTFTSSLNSLRH